MTSEGDRRYTRRIKTVLLASNEAAARALLALTAPSFRDDKRVLAVEVYTPPVGEAVAEARARHGRCPLGVIASDEIAALEALSSGADEAAVLAADDSRRVLGFLERVGLRAGLRREQERTQTSAAQSEKLAALGTVVAGVAHEINNPLTGVLLSIEHLRSALGPLMDGASELDRLSQRGTAVSVAELERVIAVSRTGMPPAEGKAILDDMEQAVTSIAEVVRDLRIFSRTSEGETPQLVEVHAIIDQVVRILGRELADRAVVERDYDPELPALLLPRGRFTQIITNILINANQAISEISRPVHRVRISTRADDESVAISISDTGPGIPQEAVSRVFDPFFTTKREAMGTGLGLSISRSIAQSLGGDLIVESVHGDGATFITILPRRASAAELGSQRRRTPPSRGRRSEHRATVLVVDDDELVLRSMARTLRSGYDVILAADADEAMALLGSGSAADAVVIDLGLSERSAITLHSWLQARDPDLAQATLFTTTVSDDPAYAEFVGTAGRPVLDKPIRRDHLLAALDGLHRSR